MFKLIRTEIEYFKVPLIGILFLLFIFTGFALNNSELFSDAEFLRKYIWSMIVGLGSYGLVFALWVQRVKEKHERLINLLPLKLSCKNLSRWIFAVLPFIFVMSYVQILHFFLSDDMNLHVGRISAQIGFLSMALASIMTARDYWYVEQNRSELYKILSSSVIFIIAVLGAIIITRIFTYNIVPPLYIHQEELMFFAWGLSISAVSLILYKKRKNYLE